MNAIDKALGLVTSLSASKATIPQQPQLQQQPPSGGYSDGGYGGYSGGYGYAGTGQPQDDSDNTTTEKPQLIDIDIDFYTTLEPCSKRISGLKSCAQAILDLNASSSSAANENIRLHITRVFIGAAEPPDFVVCKGAKMLSEGGVEVVWLGERKVRLSECDLVELGRPGHDPSEEVDLASVCLRAARRGNE
jgi:hypothetical protein